MQWSRLVVFSALALIVFVGCEFKGDTDGSSSPGLLQNVWQPRAETLRVHPSTRFVRPAGERRVTLQTRIEALDAMGDPIKAVGSYRLELFASDELGRDLGRRLHQWQVDVETLNDQRSYYDSVTRSYLFRLRLSQSSPPNQATLLRITFTPADRRDRLETSLVLSP